MKTLFKKNTAFILDRDMSDVGDVDEFLTQGYLEWHLRLFFIQ